MQYYVYTRCRFVSKVMTRKKCTAKTSDAYFVLYNVNIPLIVYSIVVRVADCCSVRVIVVSIRKAILYTLCKHIVNVFAVYIFRARTTRWRRFLYILFFFFFSSATCIVYSTFVYIHHRANQTLRYPPHPPL